MELLAKPKQFFKYKIQPDKSPLKDSLKMTEVKYKRLDAFELFTKEINSFLGNYCCDRESTDWTWLDVAILFARKFTWLSNVTRIAKFF